MFGSDIRRLMLLTTTRAAVTATRVMMVFFMMMVLCFPAGVVKITRGDGVEISIFSKGRTVSNKTRTGVEPRSGSFQLKVVIPNGYMA